MPFVLLPVLAREKPTSVPWWSSPRGSGTGIFPLIMSFTARTEQAGAYIHLSVLYSFMQMMLIFSWDFEYDQLCIARDKKLYLYFPAKMRKFF